MDWQVEVLLSTELSGAEAKSILEMTQVQGISNGFTRLRSFVFAASMRQAANDGLDRFNIVLSTLQTTATIVALEVTLESVRLNIPSLPDIVGGAEVQQILDIAHRQQLNQMACRPNFPQPIVVLAASRIWLRSDIEAFKLTWRR